MSEEIIPTVEPVQPHLWNPIAAAKWSLLLTPAFGAILHASNWKTLGKPKHARSNMIWLVITVIFLAVNLGTLLLPDSRGIDAAIRIGGLALLLGWYFSLGKSQVIYVTDALGNDYAKKGWAVPLLAGFGAVCTYLGIAVALVFMTFAPGETVDEAELAAQVKQLVIQEWRKKPELGPSMIQNLTLKHTGGNSYTGFVDARLAGKPAKLAISVTVEDGTISWQVTRVN
jgi:hypothetical protein